MLVLLQIHLHSRAWRGRRGSKDQWRYLKPRHALRSIYHVFSLICFLQLFEVSASLEMASIAA
jgi:hypothetical protein